MTSAIILHNLLKIRYYSENAIIITPKKTYRDFDTGFGGKGANQCIACGRLGGNAVSLHYFAAIEIWLYSIFLSRIFATHFFYSNAPKICSYLTLSC